MDEYERFLRLHHSQLQKIPEHLWRTLHYKLQAEVYDSGEYFMLSPSKGRWRVLVTHRGILAANDISSVFLVDHAWTFQPHLVTKQLQCIPGLASRMSSLMDLDGLPCLSGEEADSEELSEDEDDSGSEGGGQREAVPPVPTTSSPPPPAPLPPLPRKPDPSESSSSSNEDTRRRAKVLPAPVKGGSGYDSLSGYESYAAYESCDIEEEEGEGEGGEGEGEGDTAGVVHAWAELTNQIEVPCEETPPTDELVARIQEAIWQFCYPYHINNSQVPVWYVMDEFGSRIPHSDNPSIAMTSFLYVPRQLAYCVFWTLRDLKFGDTVTRDYLSDIGPDVVSNPLQRACHLIPWSHDNHLTLDDPKWQDLPHCTVPPLKERCGESSPVSSLPPAPLTPPFTVYTDIELVRTFLTHPLFEVAEDRSRADILWSYEHFKDFGSLERGQYVNQFGCENVLTCKDLLVETAKRARYSEASPQEVGVVKWAGPKWLPETYNLLYELPHLVWHFFQTDQSGEQNLWIVKPWNLGRGMDIHITSSLHHIIRLAQAGPKVASRYITDPVLFHRPEVGLVKFDIRYVIMLKAADPLEAYVYNVFWLRFANKPFSLDDFYDYEKHFTVMNYQKGVELKQIYYNDFIPMFEEQYSNHSWTKIQESIFLMLSELVKAACSSPPPAGIAPSPQSRAIYAVDLMLKWNRDTSPYPGMEPQLLEVNFSPDCVRACRYHPDFFNHVFEVLFLDPSHWRQDIPVTKLL